MPSLKMDIVIAHSIVAIAHLHLPAIPAECAQSQRAHPAQSRVEPPACTVTHCPICGMDWNLCAQGARRFQLTRVQVPAHILRLTLNPCSSCPHKAWRGLYRGLANMPAHTQHGSGKQAHPWTHTSLTHSLCEVCWGPCGGCKWGLHVRCLGRLSFWLSGSWEGVCTWKK